MTSKIAPQPNIMDISLYQSGKAAVVGVKDITKLSANENPFGPSDAAIKAFGKGAHQLHRYPNTDHSELRQAIAKVHGLDTDRIICGAGSDEVISFICQAYAGVGDEVLFTEHGFSMYRIYALGAGATPVEAPERERVTDVDALLAACSEKTRIVFIANPNNPTGTMIGGNDLARLADSLPPKALLVLDGAYAEYVEGYDGGAALVESRENIVMTRTFSKMYGLGGLRIGWGYGPKPIIDVLNRMRGPFNLSNTQLDTALAAVLDRDHVTKCRDENTKNRAWLAEALAEIGIPSDTSTANFILARLANKAEAEACDAYLKTQGIIVRLVGNYKLPNCLRITIGDQASCRRVAHAIRAFKDGAR